MKGKSQKNQSGNGTFLTQLTSEIKMAAASIPTISRIKQNLSRNKQDERVRHPTVEELLIQIENHLYKNTEHRASLLIAVWTCIAGKVGYFRNIEKVFHMLYRESAMTIFSGHWPRIDILFKRGLARSVIQFSHSMGNYVKGSEALCSALVMAVYDPWGDPVIRKLLTKQQIDQNLMHEFIRSEPCELLLIRVECLVNAHFEDAAIQLCRSYLHSKSSMPVNQEVEYNDENWRWTFMEWLLRLLFRKRKLNDLVAESSSCSCHDGVRLIYRAQSSQMEDSEPLTETLINLFLVRDLLFQSDYCCTSELMRLWCELQAKKQKSASEIQEAAQKLLVGHASCSAQFYLFVDILWEKFGVALLPLYLEMYIRGLTSDLNYLEAARQADNKEYVIEIENHMAAMYFKLSSMFNSINKEVSLECMLSAFSLDPTKERLEWIKRLSLQIAKEKALKANASKNVLCKHKTCNSNPCSRNYIHPVIAKRKSVIMCDQAIQVGDELLDSCEKEQSILSSSINNNVQENSSAIVEEMKERMEESSVLNEISVRKDDMSIDDLKENEAKGNILPSNTCSNINNIEINEHCAQNCNSNCLEDKETSDYLDTEKITSEENESDCKVTDLKTNGITETVLEPSTLIKAECANSKKENCDTFVPSVNCNHDITEETEKDLSVPNFDSETKNVRDKIEVNLSSKTENLSKTLESDATIDKDCVDGNLTEGINKNKENGFASELIQDSSPDSKDTVCDADIAVNRKMKNDIQNCNENFEEKSDICQSLDCSHPCINGFEKTVPLNNENVNVHPEIADEFCTEATVGKNRETGSLLNAKHNTLSSHENSPISTKEQLQSKEYENVSETQMLPSSKNQTNISKSMCENICISEMIPDSHVKNNASLPVDSFSHIILDSKIPGISCKLLSDFVIVLESLRNKQLKSCNKWSQIKHLCEDYLETVTNLRCMMLNMQLNGSIDSEADSTSELTAFQEFQSHQSNDSIVEDRYADKSHVFKRFMNTDKVTDMATYVNLSDIHYPQIPLEKLFYTEHSSSHIGHKKKHKKHRNHDKNPEKVALRKLRHSSRAERELIKRKKRKKRKGKRAKGHAKKHYFTHGKGNKDYVKNKKKKHKLKKKKDGNSGFISGDYCSDFSSGELMRLVKEHSNSYSKIPAATSKHPHASSFPVGVSPSIGSSDLSVEPSRKKRKVSFNKKKEKGKCRDKHKHEKSKSSKRKKKIVIESCQAGLKNLTPQDTLNGSNINSVGDYSRIVQFSSVKKMEAVQIRQRSVALNLSNQSRSHENETPLVHQCPANPQIKHLVQQNFDNYSPEDIMKMQLLLARQQPEVTVVSNANSDFISSANNQAVLKYVCSKMTSHLLSVAQSSNCIVGSDSEASKSPIPVLPGKVSMVQNSVKSFNQPQNLSSNIKHVIIERKNLPYNMKNSNTSVSSSTLIPISLASPSCSDAHNMMGTVFSSGLNYPTSVASPQMTTFAIPVAHNASKNKLVAGKLMIPINTCGNIRSSSTLPSTECENHAFATASGNQPLSGVILVKNGNSARIIPSSQQQCNVMPCLSAARFSLPSIRQKASTTVTKTVPKIIKQAAKKLTQPQAKKPRLKPPAVSKIKPIVPSNVVTSEQTTAVNLSSDVQPAINKSEICAIPPEISLLKSTNTDDTPSDSDMKFSGIEEKPLSDDNASLTEGKQEDNKNLAENERPVVHSPQSNNSNLAISSIPNSPASVPSSPKQEKTAEPSALNLEMKENQEIVKENIPQDSISESKSIQNSPSDKVPDIDTNMGPGTTPTAPCPSPVNENVDKTDVVMVAASESPPSEDSNATHVNVATAIASEKENLPLMNKAPITSTNVPVEKKETICTVSKNIAVSHDQQKQLQPITVGNILSNLRIPGKICSQGKAEGGNQVSEVPTRSFTSISDAVRFSLMDMDDATDSVENQVLHAFQVSHESSQDSPRYDNTSTNGGDTSTASPTPAVILTTPQSTSTTELNVSRVSQFETSVHSSQSEKFTECQSTVSRTTTWILEDSSVNETAQQIGIQKSPDVDSSGETKDDNKPKKKKKRKERSERDPDAAHKFWCEICHKGFFSAYNLRRHCRNVHKMDLPKGSSDVPFASSSQCLPHIPQTDSASSDVSAARVPYGTVQQSSVSPKAPDFMLQSPTRETKSQDFAVKSSPTQHVPQMQSTEFQMQTPPRMSSQSTSTHVSPVTPPKDFRLPTPTTVSSQITQSKLPVGKSANSTKFQRQPSSCPTSQVPQLAKMSQMPQITLCGQSALQQQRQIGQLPSTGLIQPLSSVGCQAQQLQPATQCPHFQQNKQIVQQRLGQLQLMHHVGALPPVQHATHGIQKQTPVQQFKKCVTTQQVTKITETEQIQAAQIAQNQQILANQQMQKLIQIRQNAIAAAGVASQLSLGTTVPGVQGSSTKGGAQCFQSQLAAARQAAAVAQLPANQRSQGTNYNLPSHDASGHQFFSPAIQPNQEQPSCPHSSFSTQNIAEFSANTPSYPSIRSSSETNDGLEDLEQFLLENMPWSGDQSATHNLAQQSGNRPSSADSLTLSLPTQGSGSSGQNRTASSSKGKISISRPKPRKPVATPCSKNLLGNLGRGVKKKSCVKKIIKPLDVDCIASKSDIFTQADAVNQQTSRLDLIQKTCSNKDSVGDLLTSKKDGKNTNTVSAVNETDSSDSVQCINITHSASKNASVGINFNTFTPMRLCTADKDINSSSCTIDPSSSKQIFDVQRKNSFLDHCNLVSKNCSNLDQSKSMLNIGHCEKNLSNPESSLNVIGKETNCDPKTVFSENAMSTMYSKTSTSCDSGDVFLGQRNTDNCNQSVFNEQKKSNDVYNCEDIKNTNNCAENGCAVNCVENAEKETSVSNFKENSKSETHSDFFLDGKTDQITNNSETEDAVIETHCMINSEIKSTVVQEQEVHQEKEKEYINSLNNNALTDTDSNASNKDLYIADLKGEDADLSAKTRDLISTCTDSKEADTDFSAKSTDLNVIDRDVITTGTDLQATTTDLSITSKHFNCTSSDTESVPALTHPDLKTSDLHIKNSDERETDDSYKNMSSFKDSEKNSSAANDQGDVNIYTLNESEQENKLEEIFDENSNVTETKLKCKESLSDPSKVCLQNIRSDSLKSVENNCNDTVFLPAINNHDKHVSHESNILNDENHLPNESDANEEQGPKRIALRIRKSLDSTNKLNENDKNIKYYVSEKTSDDPKGNVMKKNSQKKRKVKQENRKIETVGIDAKKGLCIKFDGDANIQKTGILNNVQESLNKEKEINRTVCLMSPCYNEIEKVTPLLNETLVNEDGFCLDEKQDEDQSMDGIPAGRLRLRDTPKTSVKRVCPCCVDSRMPKKCRANGGSNIAKLIGTRVSNALKSKSTLKTRNAANGNVKINTRSSQRLRSRNNAIN